VRREGGIGLLRLLAGRDTQLALQHRCTLVVHSRGASAVPNSCEEPHQLTVARFVEWFMGDEAGRIANGLDKALLRVEQVDQLTQREEVTLAEPVACRCDPDIVATGEKVSRVEADGSLQRPQHGTEITLSPGCLCQCKFALELTHIKMDSRLWSPA